jgi:transposase InsO family protein
MFLKERGCPNTKKTGSGAAEGATEQTPESGGRAGAGRWSFTVAEGAVTVFAAIDHCTAECIGIHAVKRANRFEALEPVRQAVRERFRDFSQDSVAGLRLRHNHGSVYTSEGFQNEIRFPGIQSSPAFVRQPEGNGCIERFFRTLKEQLLRVQRLSRYR